MATDMVSDSTMGVVQSALKGLSLRRDVISQNISNVDTPGYQAQQVNFEATLKDAINSTGTIALATTQDRHLSGLPSEAGNKFAISLRKGGSTRADGNDVSIDQELQQMTETGISYQALTTAITKKLSLLKAIAEK
jgi:flagellar basal-body rod protein FlgB